MVKSVSQQSKSKVEIPLLRAYLRSVPAYPDFVPGWVPVVGWSSFVVWILILAVISELGILGTAIAGVLGYGIFLLLRNHFKPRNDIERAEDITHQAVRRLKKVAGESNLRNRLPEPILIALEEAVQAHNAAIARLATDTPTTVVDGRREIRAALHNCFFVAAPVMRDDNMSRADWRAIQQNTAHLNEIVDAIQRQTRRMQGEAPVNAERLAALRELDDEFDPQVLRP